MGCAPSCHTIRGGRTSSRNLTGHAADHESSEPCAEKLPLVVKGCEQDIHRGINQFNPNLRLGNMQLEEDQMTILLVFSQKDSQATALKSAADTLGLPCEHMNRAEAAVEAFLASCHDLVVIDRRHPDVLDSEALCRSIRASPGGGQTIVVAVNKPGSVTRSEEPVGPLLKIGFNRIWNETLNIQRCLNELLMVLHNEFHARCKLRAAEATMAALELVTDAVEITSGKHEIEYVNPSYERVMGYTADEMMGRDARDFLKSERYTTELTEQISGQMRKGKTWEGQVIARRKSGNNIAHFSHVAPVLDKAGKIRHIVSVRQPSLSGDLSYHMSGSFNKDPDSMTGSVNGRRRESMARIHSMTIEAPITRVISIINAVQANSTSTVAQDLDKVLEILCTSDLYTAAVGDRDKDQMTADLIDGLMTNSKVMGDKTTDKRRLSAPPLPLYRQKSRSSEIISEHIKQVLESHGSHTQNALVEIPEEIVECLEGDDQWFYDVLSLERVTVKRPLVYLGMKVFDRFGVVQHLRTTNQVMHSWLNVIEENYRVQNFYHNSTHAADVMQSSAYFLERDRIKSMMDQVDEVASLLAAVVHDVDHPGRTNPFLVNSGNRLAILYNDSAVLESHHVSLAFQLTTKDDRINIFKNLTTEEFRTIRQYMIDMVLATEMAKHFEHLSKFVNNISKPLVAKMEELEAAHDFTDLGTASVSPASGDEEASGRGIADINDWVQQTINNAENRAIVRRMLIKCSDVNNPTRPLGLCKEWAIRIAQEYFAQTDEERELGLPIVMPVFDRKTCNIPKSQISFIDYFLKDMFDAWDAFCEVPDLVSNLHSNYTYWSQEVENTTSGDASQKTKT